MCELNSNSQRDISFLRAINSRVPLFYVVNIVMTLHNYSLPLHLGQAIRGLRNIVDRQYERFPVKVTLIASFSFLGQDETHVARMEPVIVRDTNNRALGEWEDIIWDKVVAAMPNTLFEIVRAKLIWKKIMLGVKDYRVTKKCPTCNLVMDKRNYHKHVRVCCNGKVCTYCEKIIEGDMGEHKQLNCESRRWFQCTLCQEKFTTGAARTAHQKKCRVADRTHTGPLPSKRPKKHGNVTKSAIGGAFRVIALDIDGAVGADYEGVFADEEDRIVNILEEQLGLGLRTYLTLDVNLVQSVSGERVTHTFGSTTQTFLQTGDIRILLRSMIPQIIQEVRIL